MATVKIKRKLRNEKDTVEFESVEGLKNLSVEELTTQRLVNTTEQEVITGLLYLENDNIDGYLLTVKTDGETYFEVSGSASILTTTADAPMITIDGIPTGLFSALKYPATNNLGTAGFVDANVNGDELEIVFNAGEPREVYFNVLLSKTVVER